MSPVSVLWDLLSSRALLTKLKQGRVKESLGISDTSFTYTCYKIVHRGTVAIESFVCMFDFSAALFDTLNDANLEYKVYFFLKQSEILTK